MDKRGIATIVDRLQHYQNLYGERFKPADVLVKMKQNQETFY